MAIMDNGKIAALDTPAALKQVIGGDVVTLKVREPNLEEVRNLEFVKKVESRGNQVMLTVTHANEHLQQILQVIGKVESVEVHSPTLNDVFLHYTGKEIRESSAEGGWAERTMHYRSNR